MILVNDGSTVQPGGDSSELAGKWLQERLSYRSFRHGVQVLEQENRASVAQAPVGRLRSGISTTNFIRAVSHVAGDGMKGFDINPATAYLMCTKVVRAFP